jgi:hypothetical protein
MRMSSIDISTQNILDQEFSTISFVCPWFLKESAIDVDPIKYFIQLERQRIYEQRRCDYARRFKQQQLWFALDYAQGYAPVDTTHSRRMNNHATDQQLPPSSIDLPSIDQIDVTPSDVIYPTSLTRMKIINENTKIFPRGFYERLLVGLHSLFYERLDYVNITWGRSIDKHLIEIQRSSTNDQIFIATNGQHLLESIQQRLVQQIFCYYPNVHFLIET